MIYNCATARFRLSQCEKIEAELKISRDIGIHRGTRRISYESFECHVPQISICVYKLPSDMNPRFRIRDARI